MSRAPLRIFLAASGGVFAAAAVGSFEAWTVSGALRSAGEAPSFVTVLLAELGVLGPATFVLGAIVGVGALLLEPDAPRSPIDWLASIRGAPGLPRLRSAAAAPLFVLAVVGWFIACAHVASTTMGAPSAQGAGLTMGVGAVGLLVASLLVSVALLSPAQRALAALRMSTPQAIDPLVTGGAALALGALVVALGVLLGDPGGAGGVPVVGVLGVLRRPELDLRPVGGMLVVGFGAWVLPVLFARPSSRPGAGIATGVIVILAASALTARAALALGERPAVADGLRAFAPLGGPSLGVLRKLTDRDHDGYSALFGGADCNDKDPRINPTAVDVPGNGVDEDCSGADTPTANATAKPAIVPVAAAAPVRPARTYNVILVTVDTLRYDLGFSGYPKPVTPNLDALAAKSTVFERAYSMASYTAKSVGPMHIGRYPSEAFRNYDHYTTYFPINTFVAERLHAANVRTVGGMCHYYFKWQTGYSEGFDVFDASAIAPGMADGDSSITSDRLSDLAIKLLSRPENVTPVTPAGEARRFFAWFHYFDPHAQYVAHPEAPPMGPYGGSNPPQMRAVYDQETWFTDKHIGRLLDHVAAQPWGKDTAIIITADHGEAFGDHGVATHGHEIWEPLVRVPLIVYVPGAEPRRVEVKRSHIDIAPTLIDITGAPVPPAGELRGQSLLDDVFATPQHPSVERDVYIDMPEGPFNEMRRAIITGPSPGMKLIHFGGRRYQLYDLAADPGEREDLSKDPERLAPPMDAMQRLRAGLHEIAVGAVR